MLAFFIGFLIGSVVGGGLVWAFRGYIQHKKDLVSSEAKGAMGYLSKK